MNTQQKKAVKPSWPYDERGSNRLLHGILESVFILVMLGLFLTLIGSALWTVARELAPLIP